MENQIDMNNMPLSLKDGPLLKRKVHPLNFLVFGLLFVILLGSLLLWLPFTHNDSKEINYIDALFTSTSATTVTGLVSVDTLDTYNFFGQLIILILINCGGLGYMTVISFFFLNSSAFGLKYAMFVKESLNLPSIGDILKLAKKVFFTIIVFEAIGIGILTLFVFDNFEVMKSLWYGIFHAMSAFNNAGFDLMGGFNSLTGYTGNVIFNFTIMALIFFGGIGFLVISDIINVRKKRKRFLTLHSELVLTTSIILIFLGAVGFYALEHSNLLKQYDEGTKWMASSFISVSSRTAGFTTVDLASLSISALLVLCLLMFIGASPGSTGAGIKTTTFAVLILWLVATIKNKKEPEVFDRRISRDTVEKALLLFFTSVLVIAIIIFGMTLFDDKPLSKMTFEAFSAFGTVGLTTGITPDLSFGSKFLLCLLMFIGRLTTVTFLTVIAYGKRKDNIHLLEENVAIG
ncbi:TrkH family potassium uptake protein [Candidatus Woesearchaeota archaeon]|nr:TrkH family potassium uptake protein [Candidatus Woesearchaeota archaeon]